MTAPLKTIRTALTEAPNVDVDIDEAIKAISTFPNGCDFKIISRDGGEYYELSYGCYGVHTNLVQGSRRFLMNWLGNADTKRLDGVSKETINELLKRKPCLRCEGFLFEPAPTLKAIHDNLTKWGAV